MLSAKDLGSGIPVFKKLSRYLNDGEELINALTNAFLATQRPLKITTCGLLKAGKSSLLNSLTDHLETELFATGAARTTVKNQTLSHQDFIFVDTPGLDATEGDDVEAWKELNMADILLFVHDPGTGELHQDEVEFLLRLSNQSSEQHGLDERLLVVLTRLDSNAEAINQISETIRKQIYDNLGIKPLLFHVSSTSYRKGSINNKNKLIEYSGIPALRKHIVDNLTLMHNTAEVLRRARINASRKQLINAADAAIAEREAKVALLQSKANEAYQVLSRDSETLLNALREKIAAYDNKHATIKVGI